MQVRDSILKELGQETPTEGSTAKSIINIDYIHQLEKMRVSFIIYNSFYFIFCFFVFICFVLFLLFIYLFLFFFIL